MSPGELPVGACSQVLGVEPGHSPRSHPSPIWRTPVLLPPRLASLSRPQVTRPHLGGTVVGTPPPFHPSSPRPIRRFEVRACRPHLAGTALAATCGTAGPLTAYHEEPSAPMPRVQPPRWLYQAPYQRAYGALLRRDLPARGYGGVYRIMRYRPWRPRRTGARVPSCVPGPQTSSRVAGARARWRGAGGARSRRSAGACSRLASLARGSCLAPDTPEPRQVIRRGSA